MLNQSDHVIAKIAIEPRGHGGQIGGNVDFAFCKKGAKGCQRIRAISRETIGILRRVPIGRRVLSFAFPDQIRVQTYDRITPTIFATRYTFKHEGIFAILGQFQEEGNRCIKVGGKPCGDNGVFAALKNCRERGIFRLDVH